MDRRQFVRETAATVPVVLAGYVFGGEETVSTELSDGESESFEASEGEECEVTVDVEGELGLGVRIYYDVERSLEELEDPDAALDASDGATSDPLLDEAVEGEETFEIEVDADGYYEVAVAGGTAEITVS